MLNWWLRPEEATEAMTELMRETGGVGAEETLEIMEQNKEVENFLKACGKECRELLRAHVEQEVRKRKEEQAEDKQ